MEEIKEVPGVVDVIAYRADKKVVVTGMSERFLDTFELLRKARRIDRKARLMELDPVAVVGKMIASQSLPTMRSTITEQSIDTLDPHAAPVKKDWRAINDIRHIVDDWEVELGARSNPRSWEFDLGIDDLSIGAHVR